MIGEKPVATGAAQDTTACWLLAIALAAVGTPGTVLAWKSELGAESALAPTPLIALTVNVYEVPGTRPTTVHPSGPASQVHVAPPGAVVTT